MLAAGRSGWIGPVMSRPALAMRGTPPGGVTGGAGGAGVRAGGAGTAVTAGGGASGALSRVASLGGSLATGDPAGGRIVWILSVTSESGSFAGSTGSGGRSGTLMRPLSRSAAGLTSRFTSETSVPGDDGGGS